MRYSLPTIADAISELIDVVPVYTKKTMFRRQNFSPKKPDRWEHNSSTALSHSLVGWDGGVGVGWGGGGVDTESRIRKGPNDNFDK